MMFVTRRGFKQALGHLKASMENVGGALCKVKTQLNARIEAVMQQVAAASHVQDELRAEVGEVKHRVDETGRQVDNVEELVGQLQGEIAEVQGKQDFANRGIFLLCNVVASALDNNSANTASALSELRAFAIESNDTSLEGAATEQGATPRHASPGLAFFNDGSGSGEAPYAGATQ